MRARETDGTVDPLTGDTEWSDVKALVETVPGGKAPVLAEMSTENALVQVAEAPPHRYMVRSLNREQHRSNVLQRLVTTILVLLTLPITLVTRQGVLPPLRLLELT